MRMIICVFGPRAASRSLLLLVCVFLALLSSTARASVSNCTSNDAPASWSSASCGARCSDASLGGTDYLLCDFSGASASVTATGVSEYGGSGADISVWGDVGGTTFCCAYTDSGTGTELDIVGSAYADTPAPR